MSAAQLQEIADALVEVINRRVERVAVPGKFRVYREDDGRVVLEIFP